MRAVGPHGEITVRLEAAALEAIGEIKRLNAEIARYQRGEGMSTDLIEMDLRQALDAASDEIKRLRAALMEICTMQGEPIQIAREALAKEEEKK